MALRNTLRMTVNTCALLALGACSVIFQRQEEFVSFSAVESEIYLDKSYLKLEETVDLHIILRDASGELIDVDTSEIRLSIESSSSGLVQFNPINQVSTGRYISPVKAISNGEGLRIALSLGDALTEQLVSADFQILEFPLPFKTLGNKVELVDNLNTSSPELIDNSSSAAFPIDEVAILGDDLYFAGQYPGLAEEVLRLSSRGEVSLAADVLEGRYTSASNGFTAYKNKLYFASRGGISGLSNLGEELYVFDGQVASLVADIRPGVQSSGPGGFIVYNDLLYFSAWDGASPTQLWSFDGTTLNKVSDVHPSAANQHPAGMTEYKGKLYFSANGAGGKELWSFDGSSASEIADINPSGHSNPWGFTVFKDKLYFSANDGSNGTELWVHDGTSASLAADLNPGSASSSPGGFLPLGDNLVFKATVGSETQFLLFNGLTTTNILDVYTGPTLYNPLLVAVSGETLFFKAALTTGFFGVPYYLFAYSNGSISQVSTESEGFTYSIGSCPISYQGSLLCSASRDDVTDENREIFSGIVTLSESGEVKDAVRSVKGFEGGSHPSHLTVHDGKLYMNSNDAKSGNELWAYDGTSLKLTEDIRLGPLSSSPQEMISFDGNLYFQATDESSGKELWTHDGNSSSLVQDINPGSSDSSPSELTVYNDKIYFSASNGTSGIELWSYDGSTAALAADINVGAGSSSPSQLFVHDNRLYFQATDGSTGIELWSFDGTSATMAADISSGAGSSSPEQLVSLDGDLYFQADDGVQGKELWRYDGSSAVAVSDINAGAGDANLKYITEYKGSLYFQADDGSTGTEIWSYDGNTVSQIRDHAPGLDSSVPTNLVVHNDKLYMSLWSGTQSYVWRYDGSTFSKHAELDFAYKTDWSLKERPVSFGNKLCFSANVTTGGINYGEELTCIID